jgi:hypothetical protein
VCALKPTSGLVPVSGVIDDEGPIGAISDPRTLIGAFARSVEDPGKAGLREIDFGAISRRIDHTGLAPV